jgi:hypothetical protein
MTITLWPTCRCHVDPRSGRDAFCPKAPPHSRECSVHGAAALVPGPSGNSCALCAEVR